MVNLLHSLASETRQVVVPWPTVLCPFGHTLIKQYEKWVAISLWDRFLTFL